MHDNFENTIRCKLGIEDKVIQEEEKFKLVIAISGYGDAEAEIREHTTTATKKAVCLNDGETKIWGWKPN